MSEISLFRSYVYLVVSAMLFGLLVFGGKVMGINGFSLAEVLILPNTVILLILFGFVRKNIGNFFKLPLGIMILYPLGCAFAQIGQYAPLFMGVSVSLTVLLLYTQPVWTILIDVLFLKGKFGGREAVTTVLVIAGLVILLAPWNGMTYSVAGVLLALLGGLCMSCWVLSSSYFSKSGIKPLTQAFFSNLYTSGPFILAYPLIAAAFPDPEISGFSLTGHPASYLLALVVYSVVVFIGAQILFYRAAQKVRGIHLGLILLLEPVVGTSLDVVFLGTLLTWNIGVGGLLIILGNVRLMMKSSEA